MINFSCVTEENIKQHYPNKPQIPDHPYRILIIEDYGSRKTNALLKIINHKLYTDKIYLYAKNLYKTKYSLTIFQSYLSVPKLLIKLNLVQNSFVQKSKIV